MANKSVFSKRFLSDGARAKQGVKQLAVVDDLQGAFIDKGKPLFFSDSVADFQNQPCNVNVARANLRTLSTADAQSLNLFCGFKFSEPCGENRPNSTCVNVAKNVTRDKAKHGTHVQTGRTADALEGFFKLGVCGHLGAVVVEQDHMDFFHGTIGIAGWG